MFTSLVLLLLSFPVSHAQMDMILGGVTGLVQGISGKGQDLACSDVPKKDGPAVCTGVIAGLEDDDWDRKARAACDAKDTPEAQAQAQAQQNPKDFKPPPPPGKDGLGSDKDPCETAKMMEKAADAQTVAMVAYLAATLVCTTECFYPITGGTFCTVGTFAAMGVDLGAAIAVGQSGDAIMKSLPFIGAQAYGMNAVGAFSTSDNVKSKMAAADGSDGTKKDGQLSDKEKGTKQGEEAQKEKDKEDSKTACYIAAMNGVQMFVRACNASSSKLASYNNRRNKLCFTNKAALNGSMVAYNPNNTNPNNVGAGAAPQVDPSVGKIGDVAAAKAGKADKIQGDAITAGYGPLLNEFEKKSGHPASDLINHALAGGGLQAAGSMMGDSMGTDGMKALGEIEANAGSIAEQVPEIKEYGDKAAQRAFESTNGRGGSGGGGGHGGGMPDLAAMMAALQPKKPVAPEANGAAGPVAAGSKANSDGLHPASKSIFEIVTARYQNVSGRFLAGQAVIDPNRAPASLLPVNPYLKGK